MIDISKAAQVDYTVQSGLFWMINQKRTCFIATDFVDSGNSCGGFATLQVSKYSLKRGHEAARLAS